MDHVLITRTVVPGDASSVPASSFLRLIFCCKNFAQKIPVCMDFDAESKIIAETEIGNKDAYDFIGNFLMDNDDLDGIYRIQVEEIVHVLRRRLQISEDDSTARYIEDGARELE